MTPKQSTCKFSIVSKDNILRAKKLIQTVIQDLGRELTPTLEYDLRLRLEFALELLENSIMGSERYDIQ